MQPERFRLVIWMKLVPLLALPVPALFLAISPVSENWSATTWYALGAIAGLAAGAHISRTRPRPLLPPDDARLTLPLPRGPPTRPHQKLLKDPPLRNDPA